MTYWPADFVGQSIPTPPVATAAVDGLETAAEHTKLAGVSAGATSVPVATATTGGSLTDAMAVKLNGIAAGATANTLAVGTSAGTAADGAVVAAIGVKTDQIVKPSATSISIPNNTTLDTTVYTVPTGTTLNLFDVIVNLTTAITGAGSCVVSLGATAGGQDYLLNVTLTSATAAGVVAGQALLSLGAAMLPASGFRAILAAGATIVCRIVTTGSITAGTLAIEIEGRLT